ncbi:arginine repressor, C-terminal domain protein [Streptococcus sp. oral taxon 056 str. F0418]|nr:arginine repressor, C-terminal domain protein [Streptococcus sp. oral taxon 056 str. F0418]
MKLAEHTILDVSFLGNMINLKLVPGSTAVIKRQIVEAFAEEIFSIIADDDSILLILKDEKNLQAILKVIKNW